MSKLVYRGSSDLDFLQSLLWRAVLIGVIVYLAFHFEENPPVIIGAGILCLFLLLISGNDDIIIYSDKVVQKDTSILGILVKSKGRVFPLKDLKGASFPDCKLPNLLEAGFILAVIAILPGRSSSRNQIRFYLDLKNGEHVTLHTDLSHKKVKEIVNTINSLK